MKQFFKYVLATIVGILLSSFLVFIIFIGIIGYAISSAGTSGKVIKVKENSVLLIKLDEIISDRTGNNPLENFDFSTFQANPQLGLNDILKYLEMAEDDSRIKGIAIETTGIEAGMATVEEIRNALKKFKERSGKFIYAYSEVYTQKSYYLASIADSIFLNPAGMMELRGLAYQGMFFKGALEKLEVEAQIIRHGKFKSAVEPFMLDKMSAENKEQTRKYMGSIWNHLVAGISETRNINTERINQLADSVLVQSAEDAVKHKLVDQLCFKDQYLAILRAKLGIESEKEKINFISLARYTHADFQETKLEKKPEIAVIYASGDIISGKSVQESMGSETISEAIKKARLDDNVKAIVLRVNSPGGSALASDVMWREVVLAKQAKPVVVSMGDVAASGGYYISCAANKIFASPNTITGSIGVFGMIPNMQGMFKNKLGITTDTVNTNKHADILTVFRPLTAEEKNIIQMSVEKIYDDFITKVAEGRNLTKEQVDEIGQGRVWSGEDALKIGLVDELGGLSDAILAAKELAGLDVHRVKEFPELPDPFEELMKGLSGQGEEVLIRNFLGEEYIYYKQLKNVKKQRGILAKMPEEFEIY